MEMVRVATVSDFEHTRVRTYRLLGRPVGLIRNPDGSFRAMEMSCKHQGADLTGGRIQGNVLTCPWHGWKYDLETGQCLWGGLTALRPHACEQRGEDLYVSLRPV